MKQYNKTTAAVLSGAAVSILGAVFVLDAELLGAIQTVLTASLVWLVPNRA